MTASVPDYRQRVSHAPVNTLLRDRSDTSLIKKIGPKDDVKENKTSFEDAFMHHWERVEDSYWFDVVQGAPGYASDRIRSIDLLEHYLSLDKQTVALQATATMSVSKLDLPMYSGTTMKSGRIRTMAMRALAAGADVEGVTLRQSSIARLNRKLSDNCINGRASVEWR